MPHGGCCPAGRRAADGVLDARYQLVETESSGYRQRTKHNVRDADATLIIYRGRLEGGSLLTRDLATGHGKPLLCDLHAPTEELLAAWQDWLVSNEPQPSGSRIAGAAGIGRRRRASGGAVF
ncbi:YpsA SLOG family protein [Pseudomonas aeruginosa]|uniref:YpsA SLOG family protein n=1 Tax=Pseudomonas aeruginosa TaxID=287 RepID=UPI00226BC6FB|nr:putative molybdenum carrier protein [Pseudomonas aeruginosa]